MEPDGDPPPFWSPSTAAILHQQHRRRRDLSPILSPVSLILLLPILALLIIFFLLPPFLSHTSQFLRPTYSVKKSWDSFNILLVVFAILCGVFARRNADGDQSAPAADAASADVSFSDTAAVDQNINEDDAVRVARWFEAPVASRLRRSSSSYPDLRQQDLLWAPGDTRHRFYDDIDVDLYRQPAASVELNRRALREESGVRVIPVDIFEVHSTRPPSPDPPPKAPSPPPPPPVNSKPKQSLHSVPRKQKVEKVLDENRSPPLNSKPRQSRRRDREVERVRSENIAADTEIEETLTPPPEDTPPHPPPVVEVEQFSERRLQRKKSGAKELATTIALLYTDRKRKKKIKRKNISESSGESSPNNVLPYIPPPPPPPPAKVYQNLFKKSTKHKRVHSVAATKPPPPPPPPPASIFNNIFKTGKSKRFSNISTSSAPPPPPPPPPSSILNTIFKQGTKSRRHKYEARAPPPPPPPPPAELLQSRRKSRTTHTEPPSTPPDPPRRRPQATWKPPLPAKTNIGYEEYLNSGAQSPLVPLPPPPPPPPFKIPDFKFVARGDFVRILSAHSSRCSSPERPDLEDVEVMSVKSSEGGDSMGGPGPGSGPSGFCPSPDVNLKADSFIARLKGEWKMDKMNSFRDRKT